MQFYNPKTNKYAHSLDEWEQEFPPKNGKFVDYRSAKEMARFWVNPQKQESFFEALSPICNISEFSVAFPEYESRFDDFGEGRNHDMLLISDDKKTTITIEGKADEPFGNTYFSDEIIKSILKLKNSENTNMFDRSIDLYRNYFISNRDIFCLRYQLIHWFAGTIFEANKNKSSTIVMSVQLFLSNKLNSKNVEKNKKDFDEFIDVISNHSFSECPSGQLIGPIQNNLTRNKKLYILKYEEMLTCSDIVKL